ncbi:MULTISPECIES: hypothetical protein [Levilactobacillus]|nr:MULTISPECIES: hypothetical protein [Levilactobacillus]QFR61433.1 hypothetical protein LZ395_07860 [Levilactobacillus zymae]GEO70252.1 hypothetical protein LAC03_21620 [Levilactobacillus acidifarinae]
MKRWCNLNLVLVVVLMGLCFFLEDNRDTMPHWLVISGTLALVVVMGRYAYRLLTQPQPQHDVSK